MNKLIYTKIYGTPQKDIHTREGFSVQAAKISKYEKIEIEVDKFFETGDYIEVDEGNLRRVHGKSYSVQNNNYTYYLNDEWINPE